MKVKDLKIGMYFSRDNPVFPVGPAFFQLVDFSDEWIYAIAFEIYPEIIRFPAIYLSNYQECSRSLIENYLENRKINRASMLANMRNRLQVMEKEVAEFEKRVDLFLCKK